ncbi:MAG: translation initiation factor IF-2 [Patescibacteria group bacterium]
MAKRSPIVVVMGHVDHGKTTLLDHIRKTSVAAREAGGITQSIGAYEITHPSANSGQVQKITFIDTPGHEAFTKMRTRGAKIADIAILVVAADDSVKLQTKEAVRIIKESETPFVVAINKIDKPNANVDKVKNDLMQEGVLLEGYGGNISYQPISAKTGEGVHELLDLILLAAEMEDLNYDPNAPANGFILESKMDSRRGIVATVIVKNGTLKIGGKIKALENFLGENVKEILPSSPAVMLGFEFLPTIGEEFHVENGEIKTAKPVVSVKVAAAETETEENTITILLKADVAGSLEALSEVIKNLPLPEEIKIKIIYESVGNITDGDVNIAVPTKALVIGFNTKISKAAENLAKTQGIKIILSNIIYELIKTIEEEIKGRQKEKINGDLEILAIFGKKDAHQIVGGKVILGEIKNNAVIEIQRKNEILGQGKIINLQQKKRDAQKVESGNEAGLLVDSKISIQIGDHIILR